MTDGSDLNAIRSAYDAKAIESVVLAYVLTKASQGTFRTVLELSCCLTLSGERFEGTVERAIRELVGAGRLRMVGALVAPGRASLGDGQRASEDWRSVS